MAIIEKNTLSLQTNAISVTEEIDEIYRRITKAIKDRSDQLKGEIDRYLAVELRNLTTLKENLDLEITNISSNCDIVDKYMNETVEWDDCELMDTKEIFLKTVEFLRHFEYENNDYSRRVRFLVSIDPNQLVMNLATFGDLNIAPHSTPSGGSVSSSHLAPPSALQPGLMRSKSDHRLATQFRQQEERGGYNDEPVLGGRKFGERPQRSATHANNDRYGRGGDYDYENDYENDGSSGRAGKSSRFRSRFVRSHQNDDSDSEQQQQQRQQELKERKDRVLDSEDVSRGQLSGIIRLSDCARVVQRLADIGKEKPEKKSDGAAAAQAAIQAAIQAQKAAMQRQQQKNQQAAADEEELARQKRKSAAGSGSGTGSGASGSAETAGDQRVAALKNRGGEDSDGSSNQAASPVRNSAATATRAEVSVNETNTEEEALASEGSDSEEEEEETEESEESEVEQEAGVAPQDTLNVPEASQDASSGSEVTEEEESSSEYEEETAEESEEEEEGEGVEEGEETEETQQPKEEESLQRIAPPVINVLPPESDISHKIDESPSENIPENSQEDSQKSEEQAESSKEELVAPREDAAEESSSEYEYIEEEVTDDDEDEEEED